MLTTAPRELVEEELVTHLLPDDDGRFRYRYCQSAVVAAYGEMTREPPPFERVRLPTLLVLGETSYLPATTCSGRASGRPRRPARVERIAAGHTLLWDALDDTAGAVERFLRLGRDPRRSGLDRVAERVDDRAELVQQRRVDAVGRALVRLRHGDGVLEGARAESAEHLAGLGRRPDAAEHAGAGREHGDGLVPHRRLGERPRGPVERVLEHSGIDELYSGVAISTASASSSASLKRCTASGWSPGRSSAS